VTRGAARMAPAVEPVIGYNFARLIAVPSIAVAPVPPLYTGSFVPSADQYTAACRRF
jgi:hypothetical protein